MIGSSALNVKADTVMSTKKKSCYTGVCFVHRMSMLFNLIFLLYRYHDWTITRVTRH